MEKTPRRKTAVAAPPAPLPAAPAGPPDIKAVEARYSALMASLVEHGKDIATVEALVNATPIGQRLLKLKKEEAAIKEELRLVMEPLKLLGDKPVKTPFGEVGYQKAVTWTLAPAAVRALAGKKIADEVITETVDKDALEALVKLRIKKHELPTDILDQIKAHPLSEEKASYRFICQPLKPSK